jgi:hypothetical protein
MYCYGCGTNNNDTVRYCTQCGENLEQVRTSLAGLPQAQPPQPILNSRHVGLIIAGTACLGIVGFAILCGAVTAIVLNSPHEGQAIAGFLALFGFAGLCFMVSRLTRLLSLAGAAPQQPVQESPIVRQLASGKLPRFSHRLPPPSVTEHTTATLPQQQPVRAKE